MMKKGWYEGRQKSGALEYTKYKQQQCKPYQ